MGLCLWNFIALVVVFGSRAFCFSPSIPRLKPSASWLPSVSCLFQTSRAPDSKEGTGFGDERTVEFQLHSSITSIPAEDWDACLSENSSPFLQHSWLRCLEESECASPSTGWVPQHVSISIDDEIVGYVPLYIKGHSMGEFIFDQQFAETAYHNGIEYYPKLLVGIPFTPATGHRILWHPRYVLESFDQEDISKLNVAVGNFLKQIAITNNLSSVHFNFLTAQEARDLGGPLNELDQEPDKETLRGRVKAFFQKKDNVKDEYLRRTSVQYHWKNKNPNNNGKPFRTFDEYLSCFKSKRRINIRRERRKVLEDENVRINVVAGRDILRYNGLMERMFEIYLSTIEKLIWGRQYLTQEFFQLLAKSDFIDNLVFVCARKDVVDDNADLRAEDVFAGTFNVVKDGVFYGRYWGCLPGYEMKNLHFEVCYWSAIDFCIEKGIRRIEPGAGGGGKYHPQ